MKREHYFIHNIDTEEILEVEVVPARFFAKLSHLVKISGWSDDRIEFGKGVYRV